MLFDIFSTILCLIVIGFIIYIIVDDVRFNREIRKYLRGDYKKNEKDDTDN